MGAGHAGRPSRRPGALSGRSRRGPRRPALAVALVLAGIGGCGSEEGIRRGGIVGGETLTVYSGLPDPVSGVGRELLDGEKLALAEAEGRAGAYKVNFVSLDAGPEVDAAVAAARQFLSDGQAVAMVGVLDSAAARRVVPLLNTAGLLLVSPGAGDPGLTCDAGPAVPERYQPSGAPTFARVVGDDRALASALVAAAAGSARRGSASPRLHVRAGTGEAGERLARLVAATHRARGGQTTGAPGSADAVVLAGADAEALAREARRAGATPLVASAAPGTLAPARLRAGTVLVSPAPRLAVGSGRAFADRFRARFGRAPRPEAALGYEAMASVLAAIERAGPNAGRRQAVIDAYLGGPERTGLLGRYHVEPSGARSDPVFTLRGRNGDESVTLPGPGCAPGR